MRKAEMTKRAGLLAILLAVVFGVVGQASATLITGTPTDFGDTTTVGTVSSGEIEFFIPLEGAAGTYGVDDGGTYGTSADTTTAPIDGPIMDMYLLFTVPLSHIGQTLTLTFTDLDLIPWNDPNGFFERLILHGEGELPSGTFTSYADLSNLSDVTVTNNSDPNTNNEIAVSFTDLNIQPGGGDFWLHLGFEASSSFTSGTWTNTSEELFAELDTTPVPEPATVLLFSSGLIGLAGLRRKFRKS